MMRVGVIDYGVGNLRSVANALQHIGAEAVVTSDPVELGRCERLILPGVGAFAHGMQALSQRRLDGFVRDHAASGTPLLGICLGMQMMMELSTEFGRTPGLGLVPGAVDQFQPSADRPETAPTFRLPNVNWLGLRPTERAEGLALRLLEDVTPESRFYFVHSFCGAPDGPGAAAVATYDGVTFAAVISRGNVAGAQFHPEKSGPDGIRMLRNFIR
jgi:glutamine amidotransferase